MRAAMHLSIEPRAFMRIMALPPELRHDLLEFVGATRLPSDRVGALVDRVSSGQLPPSKPPLTPAERH